MKGGVKKMAQVMRAGKKSSLDKKIEQFCEKTSELLTGIHKKYSSNNPETSKKKRKRRQRKNKI
jgi:hypothetical protein